MTIRMYYKNKHSVICYGKFCCDLVIPFKITVQTPYVVIATMPALGSLLHLFSAQSHWETGKGGRQRGSCLRVQLT